MDNDAPTTDSRQPQKPWERTIGILLLTVVLWAISQGDWSKAISFDEEDVRNFFEVYGIWLFIAAISSVVTWEYHFFQPRYELKKTKKQQIGLTGNAWFRRALLYPVLCAFTLGACIWACNFETLSPHSTEAQDATTYLNFLWGYFKAPIAILSLAVPLAAWTVAHHRAELTISSLQRQEDTLNHQKSVFEAQEEKRLEDSYFSILNHLVETLRASLEGKSPVEKELFDKAPLIVQKLLNRNYWTVDGRRELSKVNQVENKSVLVLTSLLEYVDNLMDKEVCKELAFKGNITSFSTDALHGLLSVQHAYTELLRDFDEHFSLQLSYNNLPYVSSFVYPATIKKILQIIYQGLNLEPPTMPNNPRKAIYFGKNIIKHFKIKDSNITLDGVRIVVSKRLAASGALVMDSLENIEKAKTKVID